MCRRNGLAVGYLIGRKVEELGVKPFECLDLWVESEDLEMAKSLLMAAMDFAKQSQCGVFTLRHFNSLTSKACNDLGLFGTSSALFQIYTRMAPSFLANLIRKSAEAREYIRVNPEISETLQESNSFFVRAQGDYGLF